MVLVVYITIDEEYMSYLETVKLFVGSVDV
jgi:hypothetical protein